MNIQKIRLTELVFAEYNPRKQLTPEDEEYQKIKRSIKEFGYVDPIIINSDYTIIGGHQRATVLMDLGWTEAECIIVDMDKDKEKALNVALNKITGSWDFEKLAQVFADLEGKLDAEITGFDHADIQEMIESLKIEPQDYEDNFNLEEALEDVQEPETKPGDLYILGDHRLLCGDATHEEAYKRLMNGTKADMIFTDPPYGVSYEGGLNKKKKSRIKNDALRGDKLYEFLYTVFENLKLNSKGKSALYVFYAHSNTRQFINAFHAAGLKQRSIIIWHKTSGGFGDFMAQYMNAYEPCIYGSNGDTVKWYGPVNEKTVWSMDKEKVCNLHPTMKPIELVSRALKNSSKQGENVLDPFGGSGSTLIACEQLNRKCYTMELDPKYCDVIVNRWEEMTGQKSIKISS